jgi:hypothetical protein
VIFVLPLLPLALVALFYAEEDFRGWYSWNKYRHQLEAQGERLELKAFIPAPLDDEQNFAAIPFIKSWFDQPGGECWNDDYADVEGSVHSTPADRAGRRRFLDLTSWATLMDGDVKAGVSAKAKSDPESRSNAAASVLKGLKTSDASLAKLREASQRPAARYPIYYDMENPWGIRLPHLINVKRACQRLELRACAELAAGQSDRAFDDIKLMVYLGDSLKDEPFLISHLVRIACAQLTIQPVWEGLAEHRWTAAELQSLQTLFEGQNFAASARTALKADRAAGVSTVEMVRTRGLDQLMEIQSPGPVPPATRTLAALLGAIVPRGWYYLEELNFCQLHGLLMTTNLDTDRPLISPQQIAASQKALDGALARGGDQFRNVRIVLRHRLVAALLLPALGHVGAKAAAAQTALNQAALGSALERYRLEHGQFPDTLDTLVPRFISRMPCDVINGQPYHYRRTDDGQFVLYSVGWDEKDNNGEPGKTIFDEGKGDWVWQYSAK